MASSIFGGQLRRSIGSVYFVQRGAGRKEFLGADSLSYLSHDSLMASVQNGADQFCSACFNGNYPVPLTDEALGQRKLFEKVKGG